MSIIVFSDDNFLIKYLKEEFNNIKINSDTVEYNDILVIDNNTKLCEKYINNFVINISNKFLENIINIKLPFRLDDLKNKINNLIEYITKNVHIFKSSIIDTNKNIIISKSKTFQLTSKELELIIFLYKNPNSSKIEILDKVWNNKNIDNKSLETTIYNIKQKLDDDSFIVCSNGNYSMRDYNED